MVEINKKKKIKKKLKNLETNRVNLGVGRTNKMSK